MLLEHPGVGRLQKQILPKATGCERIAKSKTLPRVTVCKRTVKGESRLRLGDCVRRW